MDSRTHSLDATGSLAFTNGLVSQLSAHRFWPAALLFAVLLSAFTLANPTPARAQSPSAERALLGQTAASPVFVSTSHQTAAADRSFPTGEQALLGTSKPFSEQFAGNIAIDQLVVTKRAPIDGEQALLGRRKQPKTVKQARLGEDS